MAIDNNVILLCGVGALNYFLIWRRNSYASKIIADVLFILIGFTTYLIVPAPVTDWPWGVLIAIIAGIDLLIHLFE